MHHTVYPHWPHEIELHAGVWFNDFVGNHIITSNATVCDIKRRV